MRKSRLLFTVGGFFLILLGLALGSVWHLSTFSPNILVLGDDFEAKIRETESHLSVVPGAEKSFDWRFPDHRKTKYAIVQLHGFSASRREISPVTENLAEKLGANLFMTRLCGHGLLSHGMENVTADCMINDAEEAIAVGQKMGEHVILVGTSTGAALALMLAEQNPSGISALVLSSPNFRPAAVSSVLLRGPVGHLLAEYVFKKHSWKTTSDAEEKYWTSSYPMTSVAEMMNMLSWTNQIDLSKLKIPMIVFYSEADDTVSIDLIKSKFEFYGGPKELVIVPGAPHVLAGDIKSPATTDFVVNKSEEFLRRQTP